MPKAVYETLHAILCRICSEEELPVQLEKDTKDTEIKQMHNDFAKAKTAKRLRSAPSIHTCTDFSKARPAASTLRAHGCALWAALCHPPCPACSAVES